MESDKGLDDEYDSPEEYDDFWQNELADQLIKYLCWPILLLGLCGNMLSFLVFNKKGSMRRSVSSIFFRALAVMDSLVLITMLSRYWALAQFHYDIGDANLFMCRFHPYLLYWARDLSGWILAIIAVERYIGVSRPHWNKFMFTKTKARVILVVMLVVFALLNVSLPISHRMEELRLEQTEYEYVYKYYYYYYDNEESGNRTSPNSTEYLTTPKASLENSTNKAAGYVDYKQDIQPVEQTTQANQNLVYLCCMTPGFDYFDNFIWPYLDLIKQSVLPFIIIFTCNVNIIYIVMRANRQRKRKMNAKDVDHSRAMTTLLISVSVVYLLCSLPAAIMYIEKQIIFAKYSESTQVVPPEIEAEWKLKGNIAVLLMATNSSINFPLYCLSGPKFRQAIRNLFITERELRRGSARSFSRSTLTTNIYSNNYVKQLSSSGKPLVKQISIESDKVLTRETSIQGKSDNKGDTHAGSELLKRQTSKV